MPRLRMILTSLLVLVLLTGGGLWAQTPQRIELNLDLDDNLNLQDEPLPPEGTKWHELAPVYCKNHRQTGPVEDNGDGVLSECDKIPIDGQMYHIKWVGPTLFLDCGGRAVEPQGDIASMFEPGTIYNEVHPDNGAKHELIEYMPAEVPPGVDDPDSESLNGDQAPKTPEACDYLVFSDGQVCHVVRVSTDIIVTPIN